MSRLSADIFVPSYHNTVDVGGGKQLECHVSGRDVEIFPPGFGPIVNRPHFLASIRRHIEPDTPRSSSRLPVYDDGFKLRVSVTNVEPFGGSDQKYPGIEPAWLLGRTVAYFMDNGWGSKLRYFEGNWSKPTPGDPYLSDNWHQYRAALEELGEPPYTEELQAKAALKTWTGDRAQAIGFPAIHSIEERDGGDHMIVLFERELT